MTQDMSLLIAKQHVVYARCIDNGDYEDWPYFFVEDCKYVVTSDRNHREGLEAGIIWADSQAMLIDRITALRQANIYEFHKYRHIISHPYILSDEDGEVRSETSFMVVRITRDGPMDVFAVGRYLDHYQVSDGNIKIKERIVVCDSSHFDTLLVIPL
ncbi:MAG: aromatic-ring-hydroxylating dioxygenase subunit beta [Emcibacter sp.]|nr:aromatic-ring-hydroxylating dioxygenase subunit beta [Emcibacter sp.]